MISAANAFDTEHTPADPDKAIRHADDFCAWAWAVGVGRVPETFFDVDADDIELETHRNHRQAECIAANELVAGIGNLAIPNQQGVVHVGVLQQLTASISHQSEEAATSNLL